MIARPLFRFIFLVITILHVTPTFSNPLLDFEDAPISAVNLGDPAIQPILFAQQPLQEMSEGEQS